jgi:hypothetical protein
VARWRPNPDKRRYGDSLAQERKIESKPFTKAGARRQASKFPGNEENE